MEGEMLPYRLTLPPSNQKAIDMYISYLVSKGFPYQLVTTKFKLKKAQNKDGIIYSEIDLENLGIIMDVKRGKFLKKMYDEFKGVMRGQDIMSAEFSSADEEEL